MSAKLADELAAAEMGGLHPSARLVYAILRTDGPMTRNELAELANVTPDTVSSAVHELKNRDVAGERPAPRGTAAHRQYFAKLP